MKWCRFHWIHFLFFSLHLSHVYLILHELSPLELVHLFGVNISEQVTYSLSVPVKTSHPNGTATFTIDYMNESYVFSLTSTFVHDVDWKGESSPCTYHGIGLSHPGSRLALDDCSGKKRGLVITAEGDVLLFQPLPPVARNLAPRDHVIHKRELWQLGLAPALIQEFRQNRTCLLDTEKNPLNDTHGNRSRLAVIRGALTVEIALFADEKLWQHFQLIYGSVNAENELHSFIVAVVNNVNLLFNHHSLDPKVQLKIKRYQVIKNPPSLLQDQAHNSGDVDILLDNFCQYQNSFNAQEDNDPSHWDHALLFTGYDLYRGSLKTVAGYAPVKGMCTGARSCTINEGLDFGSVFVITHEMGHSLGMFHDGDNGCDAGCCIMSPSVGAGKTTWSTCSVREFNAFLNDLGTPETPPNCLLDGGSELSLIDYSLRGEYPGQKYNIDQQCRLYHGSCWRQELREGQSLEEICEMIWCGEGEGVIRTAHPALEGTYCGENKWCLEGRCREWPANSAPPPPVHGSWTSWNDAPSDGCQLNCDAPCRVNGQLKVRRSVRLCENPPVNNGGKQCDGVAYRGFICPYSVCQGPSPNDYASNVCSNLRDGTGPGGAAISQLSGRGFQHQEQPCRIWCQLFTGSFARSVGNFPDGTPCGEDKFCIRGSCMKRSCGGAVLAADDKDCPHSAAAPSPSSVGWSEWSGWGVCSVTCGAGGRRQRNRNCQSGACQGPSSQLQPCPGRVRCPGATKVIAPNSGSRDRQQRRLFISAWSQWGAWSQCDVTCGQGLRQRTRQCDSDQCAGNKLQSKACQLGQCPHTAGVWTSWTSWSVCVGTCGTGTQQRRRFCRGDPSCLGNNAETQLCELQPCAGAPQIDGSWSNWGEWSACSMTCGHDGVQYRWRFCSSSASRCLGSNIAFSKCDLIDCPPAPLAFGAVAPVVKEERSEGRWTEWSTWTGCTVTCGGVGTEQRVRTCTGGKRDGPSPGQAPCSGTGVETRLCSSRTCPAG